MSENTPQVEQAPRKVGRPVTMTKEEVEKILSLGAERNISCQKACAMVHKSYSTFISAAHRYGVALPARGRRSSKKDEVAA
jgi:hypothetical protein